MLGESIRREDVREDLRPLVTVRRVIGPWGLLAGRVRPQGVEEVVEGGLVRLVVGRERTVGEASRCVEPAIAVRLHDEWLVAPDGILSPRAFGRHVVGPRGQREVGLVVAGPPLVLLISPDVFLPLGPRLAFGVCGGTVGEDTAVEGASPARLGGDPSLLGPGACGERSGSSRWRSSRSRSSIRRRSSRRA